MQLREIMTENICCASPTDSLAELASEMKRHNVGIMPVCDGDRLVGVITDRDIALQCVSAGSNPKDCKASDFMSSQLVFGTPDMDITHAAQLMGHEQVHRLPVVDHGRLVGMVSIGDVALHCEDDKIVAGLLREISMPVRSQKMELAAA